VKKKVAIFLSHPIQYFSPLFKYINDNSDVIDLTVYYFSDFSLGNFKDRDFSDNFSWDIDLMSGYNYRFLEKASEIRSVDGFLSCANYDIFEIIGREKFDLVVNFGWMHLSNFFVYAACIATSTPFAVRAETPLMYEGQKSGIKAAVRSKLLSFIFSKASAFFYIGTQNKKFYESFGVPQEKLFFTPYCVDNERFISASSQVDTLPMREKLGISNDKKIVLFSGKLIDRKRPLLLLEAFAAIANEAHLIYVGSGPLEDELKEKAGALGVGGSVTFAGFINQAEIVSYYALADIFVLPSVHETWGLVVNEAMCAGCAVIVSSLVGSGYDLVDGNGLVFESDNIEALTSAISVVLDEENIQRMQYRSKDIISKWGFKEIMYGFEEFFKRGRGEI